MVKDYFNEINASFPARLISLFN